LPSSLSEVARVALVGAWRLGRWMGGITWRYGRTVVERRVRRVLGRAERLLAREPVTRSP
jgi:hypothetical protein